ncbi:hypothetical protein [Burkholderia oklahomensis]|uniref:hypothetical protein n=1 Tax=Burkholderia oklahomensis TaxID=342113 RepID=UPI0011982984|nr:hypothetical protein [Burkholderia oklahomensis]QPS37123.1 hypothetical protein I6G57_17980 [Burkholderia oklahomensis]
MATLSRPGWLDTRTAVAGRHAGEESALRLGVRLRIGRCPVRGKRCANQHIVIVVIHSQAPTKQMISRGARRRVLASLQPTYRDRRLSPSVLRRLVGAPTPSCASERSADDSRAAFAAPNSRNHRVAVSGKI